MNHFITVHSAQALCLLLFLANANIPAYPAENPDSYQDHYSKLQNPITRTLALKNILNTTDDYFSEQSLADFEKNIHPVRLIDAPQASHPNASLLLWSQRNLFYNPERYPPTAKEIQARKKYESSQGIWNAGQPWINSYSYLLVSPHKVLNDGFNFLGCGTIADFNGDGFLNTLEIQRLHIEEKEKKLNKKSWLADLIVIRPLDLSQPILGSWLCNARSDQQRRNWLFDIQKSKKDSSLNLILSSTQLKKEIVLSWHSGQKTFRAAAEPLPKTIHPLDDARVWPGTELKAYAKAHLAFSQPSFGVGSDPFWQLWSRSNGKPSSNFDFKDVWKPILPNGITSLTPAEAAMKTVENNRNDSHRYLYDLAFEGQSIEPASAWVDVQSQPGWGSPSRSIWWLPKQGPAQYWDIGTLGSGNAIVNQLPRETVAWWIEWLFAFDQVRSIPKFPRSSDQDHDRISGDDHTVFDIQIAMTSPPKKQVHFNAFPSLWKSMRGSYDREVASVLVSAIGQSPPDWELPENFEKQDMPDFARIWLNPSKIKDIPPPLARHAILSIGNRGWQKQRPLLEALLDSLSPKSKNEITLDTLTSQLRDSIKNEGYDWFYFPHDNDSDALRYQKMDQDRRNLKTSLTGDPGFELRNTLITSLRMLDSYHNKKALELWSKESGPWAAWAADRLKQEHAPK